MDIEVLLSSIFDLEKRVHLELFFLLYKNS
nr:MAG TPA: hypothetical protein [Caudoviricetes sp.]